MAVTQVAPAANIMSLRDNNNTVSLRDNSLSPIPYSLTPFRKIPLRNSLP